MIYSNIFNKNFENLKDLHFALKDRQDDILGLKTSKIKCSIDAGGSLLFDFDKTQNEKVVKNLRNYDIGYLYPVINSTNWLDSHDDVHLNGCYSKTVQEQQGRIWYVDNHKTSLSDILSNKSDVQMFVDDVLWTNLGKNFAGKTQALLFKIHESKIRPDVLNLLKVEKDLENSIRMKYIKVFMAINSNDPAFKDEKDLFNQYVGEIVNNGRAYEQGYFFGVRELAIVNEGSLCAVSGGSNSATSVIVENLENQKSADEVTLEQIKQFRSLIKI